VGLRLQALLQQYTAKYSRGQPMSTFSHLAVQQILGLQAVGLPGNGVCELGELPTAQNAGEQPATRSIILFAARVACAGPLMLGKPS